MFNLSSGLEILDGSDNYGNESVSERISPVVYVPTAVGIIVKRFNRTQKRKVKLALVTKENLLLKGVIIENAGQFDPQRIFNLNSTILNGGDALDN